MLRLTIAGCVVLALAVSVRAADDDKKPVRDRGNLTEAMFKRLDANGDGKLTRDEIKNAGQARARIGDMMDKVFDKLDADKSGDLTADEFKKFGEEVGGALGGQIDPERLQKLKDRFGGQLDPERLKQLRERLQNRKPPR